MTRACLDSSELADDCDATVGMRLVIKPPLVTAVLATFLWIPSVDGEYEIFTQRYSADPSPYVADGRLYITTTHDLADQTGWRMHDYNCLSTDDLVNWRDEGIVFTMDNVEWASETHIRCTTFNDCAGAEQCTPIPPRDSSNRTPRCH